MVIAPGLERNLNGMVLAIVLAVTCIGFGLLGLAISRVGPIGANSLAAPQSERSFKHGAAAVPAAARTQAGEVAVPALSPTTPLPGLPNERFSGDGVGRKALMSTSSEDKRAFLLDSAASLRNLAHIGACELTERPLGGTERGCRVTTGR